MTTAPAGEGHASGGELREKMVSHGSSTGTSTQDDERISVAIVILAAGAGVRMRESGNKLLAEFDGIPLVKRVASSAIESTGDSVQVVIGHSPQAIRSAIGSISVRFIENADYASGLASSLKAALSDEVVAAASGAMIMLADMPLVRSADINRMIEAFRSAGGLSIVRARSRGKNGNPVILPRSLFEEAKAIEGDIGARKIVESSRLDVIEVEIGEAALVDVDTPEQIVAAGGRVMPNT
jgi:molybdenum cofactor cytidylyltransferase